MINITSPSDCCGCTACQSVCNHKAILMIEDKKGFLYPRTDKSKCVDCGICERVCPISTRKQDLRKEHVLAAYALRNRDEEVLKNSSSGGCFSVLANYVIRKGGTVYGAAYSKDMRVNHIRIDSFEELYILRGAKYSQSDLRGVYKKVREDLQDKKLVLFTGTPCQVDGLNKYLRQSWDNLITTDVICHSIPSPQVFKRYKELLESEFHKSIVGINMKDKTYGWGIDCVKYFFADGSECTNPPKYPNWVSMFESGLFTRESCFDCQYTNLDRPSDFTIGDFWDFNNNRPDIRSNKGTSVVLLNTEKAIHLFEAIKSKADIWGITREDFIQPRLVSCSIKPQKYDSFWDDYFKYDFKKVVKKYFVISIVKRIIGIIKRMLKFCKQK